MSISQTLAEQIAADIEEQQSQQIQQDAAVVLANGLFSTLSILLNKTLPHPGGCILSEDELVEVISNMRLCINLTGFDVLVEDAEDGEGHTMSLTPLMITNEGGDSVE